MRRKQERRQQAENIEKKWALLNKMSAYILRHGFRHLDMNAIASESGVGKSTLYQYFKNREEIVEEIIRMYSARIESYAEHLTDKNIPYENRIPEALESLCHLLKDVSLQFLHDVYQSHGDIIYLIAKSRDKILKHLEAFYEEGLMLALLRSDAEIRTLLFTDRMFMDMLSDPNEFEKYNLTLCEALKAYYSIKSHGILSCRNAGLLQDEPDGESLMY